MKNHILLILLFLPLIAFAQTIPPEIGQAIEEVGEEAGHACTH